MPAGLGRLRGDNGRDQQDDLLGGDRWANRYRRGIGGLMVIALYIFVGLLGLLIAATLVIFVVSTIQQRRTPLEQRIEQVKQKLRESESPVGATSILSGYRSGVSDDMVREAAEAEGYQWTGYSGRNGRQLNFQRKLPDPE
jgi:hypothetical protein